MLGGILVIAALFAGWWAIDRAQEHLPSSLNAVIDSLQDSSSPGGRYVMDDADGGRDADPLRGCPEFADDVQVVRQVLMSAAPDVQARASVNYAVVDREATRIADGGAAVPLEESGVAAALTDQVVVQRAIAAGLRQAAFQTPEASALAVGLAVATDRVATANERLGAHAEGTPAQWWEWAEAIAGPTQQVQVAAAGLTRCPA